ncbi:hypothetical protein FA15DRAFT_671328 [Coprinopsis marcescibilis]|uniref:Actin-like ATPase domain-containing protein n=1 Tax=Coprinopsis marcescibilis TaxID=230819 RepID=A0A5C3KQE5_COPMA|nr:hypothetical protein FA15DRAFT_671328 [Coprinopsis marcescibilis]
MTSRSAYNGYRRKLVLAFDVGTTFSGISYSILDPGQVPKIQGVTRFPAQEHVSGSSKIPTVIYYDGVGKARAVGAEALSEGLYEQAEEEGWIKVEWFKLHLRPLGEKSTDLASRLPPLPHNKTIVQVYSDFLRYLLDCASKYIRETHPNGPDLWATLGPTVEYVLSHPNGWEGSQQSQLRDAAIAAGLIPNTQSGRERVHFVTEGEASLHYSLENGLPPDCLKHGGGVAIVDAGGGTVDISAYAQTRDDRSVARIFEEIAPPQCHFNGSVFVSLGARAFLTEHLKDSEFFDDLNNIVRCFDRTTKLRFRNAGDPQFVKFGSTRDNEPETGIRYGQLKITGSKVAEFFEPSINCVVEAVKEQWRLSHKPFSHVVLVGGFSSSDWLFQRVSDTLQPQGFHVIRPENHLNKAVADGAMSFYIDHCVRTRVSKFTYGQFSNTRFDPQNPDHVMRVKDSYISLSGHRNIKNAFSIILPKNTQVSETKEFSKDFHISRKTMDKLQKATVYVWCYKGKAAIPLWKDVDRANYFRLCTIVVDLSHLVNLGDQFKKEGPEGPYYRLHYKLVLMFGLSELKAVFSWKENGVEKRSPANIVYDPEG